MSPTPKVSTFHFARRITSLVLSVVCMVAFLYGVWAKEAFIRQITKPWPVIWMLAETMQHKSYYSKIISVALLLSVVGDVFLELHPDTFLHGLIAFLLGHLAFIYAFHELRPKFSWWWYSFFLAWGGVVFWTVFEGAGDLRLAVAIYCTVIATMATMAVSTVQEVSKRHTPFQTWAAPVGALFFAMSDSLIAVSRFTWPIWIFRYFTITTYWIAQVLFTWSAIHVVRPEDNIAEATSMS